LSCIHCLARGISNARIDTFHPDAKGKAAKTSDDLDKDRLSEQEKLERFLGGGI